MEAPQVTWCEPGAGLADREEEVGQAAPGWVSQVEGHLEYRQWAEENTRVRLVWMAAARQ